MTPWALSSSNTEPDNIEESNQTRLDEFLGKWFTSDRLDMLLSDEYRWILIKQFNDSVVGAIWSILSLWNTKKFEEQRNNIADLIRMVNLYKEIQSELTQANIIIWEQKNY